MSKIDDLLDRLDWITGTTVQDDAIRLALEEAYNRAIDDAHDNVADSCEAWCHLVKDWDDRLLKLKI